MYNLYYSDGKVCLRYKTSAGMIRERRVAYPAALLCQPPDPEVVLSGREFRTPREAMFYAFRVMPLCPGADWRLADEGFTPCFREGFALLVEMLRKPPEARWCTRGEPEWFVQFGCATEAGWAMATLRLPCGKPAAITFRCEDLFRRLAPEMNGEELSLTSWSDVLPRETHHQMSHDTRIKLALADNGGALVSLRKMSP